MSEAKAAADGAPKKKGKLPIILVLVLVIAGGGFFMMKGKGGKKKEEIKIGKEIIPTPEILTNLKDRTSYARVVLGLQLKEGAKKEEVEALMPAIKDAAALVISSQSVPELFSEENRPMLRARLAAAINEVIEANTPHKEGESEEKDKKEEEGEDGEKDKKDEKSEKSEKSEAKPKKKEPISLEDLPNGWDSKKGPVLKIYFTDLATQ